MASDATAAQRQARWRRSQRAANLRRVQTYVPAHFLSHVERICEALRDQPTLPATEFLLYWRDERGKLHPLKEVIPG